MRIEEISKDTFIIKDTILNISYDMGMIKKYTDHYFAAYDYENKRLTCPEGDFAFETFEAATDVIVTEFEKLL